MSRRWLHPVRAAVGLDAAPASATPPVPGVRTALSMISFGFTMVKFFEVLEAERNLTVGWFGRSWAPATLGLALITIGTGALVVAAVQHRHTLEELREEGLEPRWSLALTVGTFVAVLGVFAFGSLVLRY